MRSKVPLVLLVLVALAAVGWLVLGTEGVERLFGIGRGATEGGGGAALDGSPDAAATTADEAVRRGPSLLGSKKILRVGTGGLRGRVLDMVTAKGVAKATLLLAGTGLAQEVVAARAETAADGTFRLADVAAGLDYVLRVEAPGQAALEVRGVTVRADDTLSLGDLWLGKPGTLEGLVLGPTGEPVVGAEVQLHRGMGSLREFLQSGGFMDLFANLDREPEPLARTTSKAKGAFRFEGAAAGPAALVVRAPGFRQAIVSLTLTPDAGHEPVKVRLATGATLAGKVVDAEGRGVGGVHLAAFSEDRGMPTPLSRTFTESGADGAFQFASLAGDGKQLVVAAAQGFPNAFAQANAGDTDVRLTLKRGASLEVKVVTDETDAPIAGAQVLIAVGDRRQMDSGPGSLVGALTDASGTAVLEVRPGELQMAIINGPGFPGTFWSPEARGGAGMKGPEDPAVPAGRSTAVFRVPRGVRVHGLVTDLDGNPLAGADIVALGFLGNAGKTTSAADGSYELRVTSQMMMGVQARLPGWVQDKTDTPEGQKGVREEDVTEAQMDIRMRRAVSVSGRVLDPEGRPVAGASVTVRPEREGGRGFDMLNMLSSDASTFTLGNGTYVVDGVPAGGKARVVARREGFVEGGSEAFEIGKDGVSKAPDVRLLTGASLTVKVQGAGGEPVAGARVRVEVQREDGLGRDDFESIMDRESGRLDLRSGPDGTVEANLLPPGQVTVRVQSPGHAPSGARAKVTAEGGPSEPVVVRLKPGLTLSGRVVDGDGHPVEGARVHVANQHTGRPSPRSPDAAEPAAEAQEEDWVNEWDASRRAVTDAQGAWRVTDLPERTFRVNVDKDGYFGKQIEVGEEHAGLEIKIKKQDPDVKRRLDELDKQLQGLYQRVSSAQGEAQTALFQQIQALQQERSKLAGEGSTGDGD